jgi:hypothetical protein
MSHPLDILVEYHFTFFYYFLGCTRNMTLGNWEMVLFGSLVVAFESLECLQS